MPGQLVYIPQPQPTFVCVVTPLLLQLFLYCSFIYTQPMLMVLKSILTRYTVFWSISHGPFSHGHSLCSPTMLVPLLHSVTFSLSRHFSAFPSVSHGHTCLPIFSLSLSLSPFPCLCWLGDVNRPLTHMSCLMSLCHTTVTPRSPAASGSGHSV